MSGIDDFLIEIRQDFIEEARDMIEEAEGCFLSYEKDPNNSKTMDEILRLFHSLKGSSSAVKFDRLGEFCHHAEDFIIKIRDGVIAKDQKVADTLLLFSDTIKKALIALTHGNEEGVYDEGFRAIAYYEGDETVTYEGTVKSEKFEDVIEDLEEFINEVEEDIETTIKKDSSISDEEALQLLADMDPDFYSKTETEKNNKKESLLQIESIVEVKEETTEASIEVNKVTTSSSNKNESIKVNLDKIDSLLDYFGEQVIWQKKLSYLIDDGIEKNIEEIKTTSANLDKITLDLQQTAITLRMISLKQIFGRLERVARETSKKVSKNIVFIKTGEASELDKTIADCLVDPLTHMVRNAIDHGLETNEERLRLGKTKEGKVELKAFRQGGFFYIEIIDDGRGLNKDQILVKAIEKGIAKREVSYSDEQIYNFIFTNGFSTKNVASDVSGRGVGMDVVKKMFSDLKGTCEIHSEFGKGTRFVVKLPLALAMFQGCILRIGDKQFIMPNSDYSETEKIDLSLVETINDNKKVINYKNEVLPVICLKEKFKIEGLSTNPKTQIGAIIPYENEKYMMIFDELVSQERIVLKDLMPNVKNINGIAGGTILNDGRVALVLEMKQIVEHYKNVG
ncbi:hypothetical protein A9Q84_16535 [Halobacteriovorax marinus]|uniref:Chemotaxis protein CheA n=1 Tax=Halobacteriovorax marinus TaxID=97084 RepID=A0A1Y5F9U4_9BACT|nr:hypothetical protein A9Q84_16535 [Halobacteriovorax marinus]